MEGFCLQRCKAIHWFLSLGEIIWLPKEIYSCKEYFVIGNRGTDLESDYPPFTSCATLASSLLCFGCCLTSDDNKSTYLIGLRVRGFKEMRIKILAQRLVHGKCFKILLLLSPRAFPYIVMGRGGATEGIPVLRGLTTLLGEGYF